MNVRRIHDPSQASVTPLPRLVATVRSDGELDLTLDGHPYVPPSATNVLADRIGPTTGNRTVGGTAAADGGQILGRSVLPEVAAGLVDALATPVRVEVIETDGGRFTDILIPQPTPPGEPLPEMPEAVTPPGLHAAGFESGEQVALAVVVTRVRARDDGTVQLQLPAQLVHRLGQLGSDLALIGAAVTLRLDAPGAGASDHDQMPGAPLESATADVCHRGGTPRRSAVTPADARPRS